MEDLMDLAVKEFMEGHKGEPQNTETQTQTATETKTVATETQTQATETQPQQVVDIPIDKLLEKFNELSGLKLDSVEKIKDIAEKYNKVPEYEQQLEVLPELLDFMGKFENPLNYFKDEIAFKVNELSKDKQYDGKEDLIDKVLGSNLNEINNCCRVAIAIYFVIISR